MSYMRM